MPHKQDEHRNIMKNRNTLSRYAWLSIGAAILTIILKFVAYALTGSVGLLSDALESFANLIGASVALAMLIIAAKPPDESHMYGHGKAEYFSSTVEGLLILAAAGGIIATAIQRMIDPRPLEGLGVGLVISGVATLVNFSTARILMAAGKRYQSITLEADAHHLLTDVWTSASVIISIGFIALTGWIFLDPIVAIMVALNIIWTGIRLVGKSVSGLMDSSLPAPDQERIEKVLATYRKKGVEFHALRTHQSAARRFVTVHVLVPGEWTVHDAHHVAENIERDIRNSLGTATVFTHLEPVEDELSMKDVHIDRQ